MQLIGGTASHSSSLPARGGAWRLRPGEVPSWIDLPLERRTVTAWRARASQVGLGVDAWLAALVEFELVRSHMAELGLDAEEVVSAAERSLKVSRLAPTPGLRQWSAQLSDPGSQGNPPPDELPSVVLPERLLAQLAPSKVGEFLANAAGEGVESEALLLERAAAAYGVTMDTWAYQVALRRLQTAGGLS